MGKYLTLNRLFYTECQWQSSNPTCRNSSKSILIFTLIHPNESLEWGFFFFGQLLHLLTAVVRWNETVVINRSLNPAHLAKYRPTPLQQYVNYLTKGLTVQQALQCHFSSNWGKGGGANQVDVDESGWHFSIGFLEGGNTLTPLLLFAVLCNSREETVTSNQNLWWLQNKRLTKV